MVVLKYIAFSNSKSYFIYFNISLYNTPNINDSIFFTISFKYNFFINFYSSSTPLSLSSYLSLSHMKMMKNNQQTKTPTTSTNKLTTTSIARHLHCHPQPTSTFTTHHNFDLNQKIKKKKKTKNNNNNHHHHHKPTLITTTTNRKTI